MLQQLEQLEQDGYTVFPKFIDPGMASAIRNHMDALLPSVGLPEDGPVVRTLRHPIPGAIMAEILNNPRLLHLTSQLLSANELRLLEQVLIRTDPSTAPAGATGWHIDMPFMPCHRDALPRQTYFHMVHALNSVAPGGGAFMIVPGSHHLTYVASSQMSCEADLAMLHHDPVNVAGVDTTTGIEVCPEEGDLLVFNPMAVHSASINRTEQPRYVYFASFFDTSAEYLNRRLREERYRNNFPASLRENLPTSLLPLLEH